MRYVVLALLVLMVVGCTRGPIAASDHVVAQSGDGQPVSLVITRGWYDRLQQAASDRDMRPFHQAVSSGEIFFVPPGTRLRVLKRDGSITQVEVLEGEHAGRAGYLAASRFKP